MISNQNVEIMFGEVYFLIGQCRSKIRLHYSEKATKIKLSRMLTGDDKQTVYQLTFYHIIQTFDDLV